MRRVAASTRATPAFVTAIAQGLFRAEPGDALVEVLLREFRSMQRMMKQMTSGRGMAGLLSRFR